MSLTPSLNLFDTLPLLASVPIRVSPASPCIPLAPLLPPPGCEQTHPYFSPVQFSFPNEKRQQAGSPLSSHPPLLHGAAWLTWMSSESPGGLGRGAGPAGSPGGAPSFLGGQGGGSQRSQGQGNRDGWTGERERERVRKEEGAWREIREPEEQKGEGEKWREEEGERK